MGLVAGRVSDKRMLRLIRACLTAGVLENGLVSPTEEGSPQGGPRSPLLANLMLNELDRELERRVLRFTRFADDCNIYVKSKRAGGRVMNSLSHFITHRLKLKVNQAKSAVARTWERQFLGFSFTAGGKKTKRRIAAKAVAKFKQRVRELTRRSRGVSIERVVEELTRFMHGWISYYGYSQQPSVLQDLDSWVKRRLRCASLGAVEDSASEVHGTEKTRGGCVCGGAECCQRAWPVAAQSDTGAELRTVECLLQQAWTTSISVADESLTSRTAVYVTRMHGGVGGRD